MRELFKHFFNYHRSLLSGGGSVLPGWWSSSLRKAWAHCRIIQRLEIVGLLSSCLLTGFLLERIAAPMVLLALAITLLGYGIRGAHSEAYCRGLGDAERFLRHALLALVSHSLVLLGNGGLLMLAFNAEHGVVGGVALVLLDLVVLMMLSRQLMTAYHHDDDRRT
jgi:hypothetical protein